MSFQIQKAVRRGIVPLIILYGGTNRGKTFSALLLARGIVGRSGIIRGVDTEKGRMSIFAEDIPGGFDVVDLDEPFTPDRYEEAVSVAANGASIVVVDSGSHSWEGDSGVLEMAEKSKADTRAGLHNFAHKPAHSRMLRKLCRMPIPVIICLRGKDVYRQVRNDKGRTEIVKEPQMAPVQDKHFLYEAVIALEMVKDENGEPGHCRIEKYTSGHLLPLLPRPDEQISIAHGERIAAWCRGETIAKPVAQIASPIDALKAELKAIGQELGLQTNRALQEWLVSKMIIDADWKLADLTEDVLRSVIVKANKEKARK